jgi:hypothetical protein
MTRTAVADRGLERGLGVLSISALVVGEVIAVGIFLTPAGMDVATMTWIRTRKKRGGLS